MVPESEIKAEVHKTGHMLVDLIIAGTALFISLCSLGLAIHQGHAMDRLVEATSTPVLEFQSGDLDPRQPDPQHPVLYFSAQNPGTGIARIEWFNIRLAGHDSDRWQAILKLVRDRAVASGKVGAGIQLGAPVVSDLAPSYLKPESTQILLTWPRTQDNAPLFDLAKRWRGQFHLSACYCSIFDQCWVADSKTTWPRQVRSCAANRPASPQLRPDGAG